MSDALPVTWVPREDPLPIRAVAARGAAAEALVARLRAEPRPSARGLGGPGWIVLLDDDPPWVDELTYLGRDPLAPRLLLPTQLAPHAAGVPVASLLDRHVAARCPTHPGPFAVLPGWAVIPLGGARPVDPEVWRP